MSFLTYEEFVELNHLISDEIYHGRRNDDYVLTMVYDNIKHTTTTKEYVNRFLSSDAKKLANKWAFERKLVQSLTDENKV